MSTLRIPHPHTTLHLYRHLLREASYLPPVAHPVILEGIRIRFRHHRSAADTKHQLRAGHHGLRYLRAANAGDMERMQRILLLTFGRLGRRRRQLIRQLVAPEPKPIDSPVDTDALAELVATSRVRETTLALAPAIATAFRENGTLLGGDWLAKWDLKRLKAFAKSQARAGLGKTTPKAAISDSKTDPEKDVPSENIWGRPLSAKLARSKLRKGWKAFIQKVLPPVPGAEWNFLRSLAEGTAGPEWAVPARRPVAQDAPEVANDITSQVRAEWPWELYATRRVQLVDKQKSRRNRLLSGVPDETSPIIQPPRKAHTFTRRFWRRQYAHIWSLTATMEEKQNGTGWDIKWGAKTCKAPPATPRQMEFFEGISSGGKLAAPPQLSKKDGQQKAVPPPMPNPTANSKQQ